MFKQPEPLLLATVRRLLQAGLPAVDLLGDSPPDFIQLEWDSLPPGSEAVIDVLKTMAFAQSPYSFGALASITGHNEGEIEAAVASTGFLSIDKVSRDVSFCSDAHRRYTQQKFNSDRQDVLAALVKYHARFSSSDESFTPVVRYLEDAGKFRDLLAMLGTQHFLDVASKHQSLSAIQVATQLGLKAASNLDDIGAIARFTAQSGFLSELSTANTSRAEIEARVQLGDKALAIALAQQAALKEDRLALLAAVAAALMRHLDERDDAIVAQIAALIDQVDFDRMGDRSVRIASDLVNVEPDLAFRILESTSNSGEAGAGTVDTSVARLAIHALNARNGRSTAIAAAEKGRTRVKDPDIQEFLTSISLFLETTSAREVIRHAESLEPQRAIYFLRQWAEVTSAYDEVADVLDYALNLILKTKTYTPQVRDFRELATPLLKLKNADSLRKLVKRFDSQRSTVMDLGTNEELARLQLQMATAEARFNTQEAQHRFLEVYWQTSDVRDLPVRAACLSWMISTYSDIDLTGELESREGLRTVLDQDLTATLDELFRTTANHFEMAKGAIRALARSNLSKALDLADRLNTLERRDKAYLEAVRYACRSPGQSFDIPQLILAIDKIADNDLRDRAIVSVVSAFCRSKTLTGAERLSALASLINLCTSVSQSLLRARRLADLYNVLRGMEAPKNSDLQVRTLELIESSWSTVDATWRKATLAFQIAGDLGKSDSNTARTYVERGEQMRRSETIIDESQFDQYALLVRLAIRAFSGLLQTRADDEAVLQQLSRVIDAIPATGERAILWAELACRAYLMERHDLCDSVVSLHVRPLLDQMPSGNLGARWRAFINSAPALYAAHRTTTLERISRLPTNVAEDCAANIATFVLNRSVPGDAYVHNRASYRRLRYEQIVDLFAVFKILKTDGLLFYFAREITRYATSRRGREELTKQHVADIAERVESEILGRLPDHENIKHDGYVIATLAQIGRLRGWGLPKWNELIERAKGLPNSADQAYVLTELAEDLASRHPQIAEELFRYAKQIIDNTAANVDRIDRLEAMAEAVMEVNPTLAKECVKSAYAVACRDSDIEREFSANRRDLLDLAHSIDPEFAEELIDVMDDDLSRSSAKFETKKHLRTLRLQKTLNNGESEVEKLRRNREELSAAAWRSLGLLNAGLSEPLHFDQLRPHLKLCAELPLKESSFPILAWIIENQVRRIAQSPAARGFFSGVFLSLIRACESALAILGAAGGRTHLYETEFRSDASDVASSTLVVRVGEREKGLEFLSSWIAEAGDYLKICDQYFREGDLELIRMIRAVNKTTRVAVLTSKAHQSKSDDLEELYQRTWRNQSPATDSGNCDIYVIGTADSGEFPIHDRWWIGRGTGLRVGTSFNSLGIGKSSEISILRSDEVRVLEEEVDLLLQRRKREHKGVLLNLTIIPI